MEKYQYDEFELAMIERSTIPMAVYQFVDKRVVTLALSGGFCRLLGYGREEAYALMERDMYRDAHPDDKARIATEGVRFATEGGEYNVIFRTKLEGHYHVIHAHGEHHRTDDGVRVAVVWYDDEGLYDEESGEFESLLDKSNKRKLHQETFYLRSHYDQLTGLPSMTYFFEMAEAARQRMLEKGKEPALLFLDVAGMKLYNNKYGFAEGDRLLSAVARVLVKHFTSSNCSRFAQDHFVVFTEAEGLEEKLQQVFEECARASKGKNLPVKVGIYLDSIESVDSNTACDRAKYACDLNRGRYTSGYRYFDREMLAQGQHAQYILGNFDRALKEGWIEVYYQPIIRAANGKVCDEEALARWIDPEKGLLSPDEFILILEDAKLIHRLDLHVLDQVLLKMKHQADAGLHVVPQSVNLSRVDFETVDIVGEVCRRVDAAGIEHGKLTIEVTESVIGSDFEFMKEQVELLRSLGFKVWMDDFGSGYSSLDVLQSIHFDLIKLDMRFMERFEQGEESKIIITELVRMALALGVDTVAEGVETHEQAEFLKEIGCTKLQGYFYSKPVPLDEAMDRYKSGLQISLENPDEAGYYSSIGKVNLYDMAVIARDDLKSFKRYFDTIPMAIVETNGHEFWIARCNRSYRDYMGKAFGNIQIGAGFCLHPQSDGRGALFLDAVARCVEEDDRVIIDESIVDGESVHAIVRRIAVNPVKGVSAAVVAVLVE